MSEPTTNDVTALRRRGAIWLLLFMLGPPLLVAAAAIPVLLSYDAMRGDNSFSAAELTAEVGIDQKLGAQAPADVELKDEQGDRCRLGQLMNGKPTILILVYSRCPMLCNMALDGLTRSMRELGIDVGRDFNVWTVSIDSREGPELAAAAKQTALSRYGRGSLNEAEVSEGWHFLTGDEQAIRALADAVGFRYKYDSVKDQFAHAAGLMVLSPQGVVTRYLLGVQFPAGQLRLALYEASDGKTGALADKVMLLCYEYDPASGKYGLAIMRLLRFAALATVAGMIGGVFWMVRRERASPKSCQGSEFRVLDKDAKLASELASKSSLPGRPDSGFLNPEP